MIVAISGKLGSGKDTVGKIIQIITQLPHLKDKAVLDFLDRDLYDPYFINKKFADKLKDFVCSLIGCTREQLEDRDFKEKPLPEEWWYYKLGDGKIVERFSYDNMTDNRICEQRYLVKTTPRLLLQLMGTDCGRNILHPNIWVNALMSEYKPKNTISKIDDKGNLLGTNISLYPNWVITDMRFPNELDSVKKRKGLTIRVNRDSVNRVGKVIIKKEHASETALDDYQSEFDCVIDNNGSLLDLIKEVRSIILRKNVNVQTK